MKYWFCRIAAVGILAMFLSACESDNIVYISDADNGRTVTIATSDTLEVGLKGNATTGYEWQLIVVDQTILMMDRDPIYEANTNTPGAGGTYYFFLRTKGKGQTPLKFADVQISSGTIAGTYQATIIVQ